MNSKQKGKRGERQWRDELRANGYDARRGQQFSGSPDSPDVVCDALPWVHFEVKLVERLRVQDAMDQASRDAGANKVPIVAHKRNFRLWLVTMEAETFFKFLRGELPPDQQPQQCAPQQTISNDSASECEPGIQKTENQQNKLQKEQNETESK